MHSASVHGDLRPCPPYGHAAGTLSARFGEGAHDRSGTEHAARRAIDSRTAPVGLSAWRISRAQNCQPWRQCRRIRCRPLLLLTSVIRPVAVRAHAHVTATLAANLAATRAGRRGPAAAAAGGTAASSASLLRSGTGCCSGSSCPRARQRRWILPAARAPMISRDSLAFVDKCQGRLSRLPACAGVVRQRCEPSRRPR
jgi:hypothetical protein